MKRFIVIGIGLLGLLVIGVVIYVILNINPLVKGAINTYGPKMTQTAVSVEDVSLSIFSGQGSLSGLYVGNPEGFKQPDLMKLGKIDVGLDLGTVTSEQIVIDHITLLSPHVTYEQTGKSPSNFEVLMDNIKKATGGDKPAEEAPADSEPAQQKNLLIKDFRMNGGKVTVAMTGLGGESLDVDLPDIHLTDIGGDKPVDQVIEQLLDAIYMTVQQSILDVGIAIYENGKLVAEKALDFVGDTAGDIGEGVGDAASDVGEGAGEVLDDVGQGVEDVGKSLF